MPKPARKKKSASRHEAPRRAAKAGKTLHAKRYPNETTSYRKARDKLLKAESDLRRQIETVAALRRKLPLGGEVREDYVFEEQADVIGIRKIRLSDLFAPGKDTLILYNYMYGPNMERPCPMCTSIVDSLDGAAEHVSQRTNIAVVAKSSLPRIMVFAKERGWRHIRLLSSGGNDYNLDYFGEDGEGHQWPILNVFVKRGGTIRHFWGSELAFVKAEKGQNQRHVDSIWPLWNLLDFTPEGRGKDWYPKLSY